MFLRKICIGMLIYAKQPADLDWHKNEGRAYNSSMKHLTLPIVVEADGDGYFVSCPTLQGCYSQGDTYEDAVANIKDAITGYLASLKKHNEPIPPPITEEVVEVSA